MLKGGTVAKMALGENFLTADPTASQNPFFQYFVSISMDGKIDGKKLFQLWKQEGLTSFYRDQISIFPDLFSLLIHRVTIGIKYISI